MTWLSASASALRKQLPALESVLWPALLLPGSMVLLQAHGIAYWQIHAGNVLGVLTSLQLEAIALWLLYQPDKRIQRAGLVTAILLVGVPIWQLAQAPLERLNDAQVQAETKVESRADAAEARAQSTWDGQLKRLEDSAAGYRRQLDNLPADATSTERMAVRRSLDKADSAVRYKQDHPPAAPRRSSEGAGWLAYLKVVLDILPSAASLMLFQSANVLAIRTMSRFRHGEQAAAPAPNPPKDRQPKPKPETTEPTSISPAPLIIETTPVAETNPAPETAISAEALLPKVVVPRGTEERRQAPQAALRPRLQLADEMAIKRLQHILVERIRAKGSAAAWCGAEGVNTRDLSFLLNHFERVKQGKDTISPAKLAVLMDRFGKSATEATGA